MPHPYLGPPLTWPRPVLTTPPHLALRGTVIDGVLVHSTQVLHEAVRAKDPAHLDQEHRERVRPLGAQPNPFRSPRPASTANDCRGRAPHPPILSHLPACDTEGLASATDGQGAFPHAREAGCPRSKRAAAETGVGARSGGWVLAGTQTLSAADSTPC